ncbi:hypothetical protein GCM10009680_56140 [Streptomyces yatensis]|uniref:Insertion element IS402-like domain-containing protein n=1 Tax=Streptomyces yatensis TaxID=155177 RepID=A0ABP4UNA0_9ACTN
MEDRQVINGMVYKIRTGISWRDLPERNGPWKTVYTRFRRYALDGVFSRVHHRPGPPARRRDRPKRGQQRQDELDDHALGRSRGELTTKVHLACAGKGRPLTILITPGQRHDSICARTVLERIRVPRTGLGRPCCRPAHLIADKAYSSRGFRVHLRRRGITHTVPEKTDQQRHHRGSRGGRPPACDRETYRRRNTIDRHVLRSGGHTRLIPALGKISLKTDPSNPRSSRARPGVEEAPSTRRTAAPF